jgi:undecaprenyl-diphosphatase
MNYKSSSSFPSTLFISLLCALGFGCVAFWVGGPRIKSFDQSIISFIQGIGTGLPIVAITICVLLFLYFVLGHRKELIFVVGVVVTSTLLNVILKLLFHRERPTIHRLFDATGYSFPSGHAMAAFSLYATLIFLLWKHIPTGWGRVMVVIAGSIMIAAIGLSRIYLGVHYPSDVIGGYLASSSVVFASIWFYQRYMERFNQRMQLKAS